MFKVSRIISKTYSKCVHKLFCLSHTTFQYIYKTCERCFAEQITHFRQMKFYVMKILF